MCTIGDYWIVGAMSSHAGIWRECGYKNETMVCREIRTLFLLSENIFLPNWLWVSRLFAILSAVIPIFAIVLSVLNICNERTSYIFISAYSIFSGCSMFISLVLFVICFDLKSTPWWLYHSTSPYKFGWCFHAGWVSIGFAILSSTIGIMKEYGKL